MPAFPACGILDGNENLGKRRNEQAPPGFEPGMADLQSAALPLGEGAGENPGARGEI